MSLHLVTGYAGKAHVTSADQGAFNASIYGAGDIVFEVGKQFDVSVISNNLIRILDGEILMQGRHVILKRNTYEEVTIANGLQGLNRNDLIVARYTKDASTGVENVAFVVIQGVSTDGNASDPEYTTGNILEGNCLLHDMPLYRIPLNGLNIGTPVKLFNTAGDFMNHKHDSRYYTEDEIDSKLEDLSSDIEKAKKSCSDGKSAVASAITAQGVSTSADATFATMATNIETVGTNKYNAGYNAGYEAGGGTGGNTVVDTVYDNGTLKSGISITGFANSDGMLELSVPYNGTVDGTISGIDNSKACLVKIEGTYSMPGSNNQAVFKTVGNCVGSIGHTDLHSINVSANQNGSFEIVLPISDVIKVDEKAGLAGNIKISKITTYY